jgi:tripartite-type tricarboxylate transporter receptor subunit TctC
MRPLFLAVAVLSATSLFSDVRAQSYPSRPITLVVPWPAGGPSDVPARLIAEHMKVSLGQPVIVENVAGASGSTGTGRVARAAPDGYTLIHGNFSTHVINGAVFKLPYDVQKDFTPIALLAQQSFVIVGRKSLPAESLTELVAWLKSNPDKASQATGGPGGMPHLMGLRLQKVTGARFNLVPYRGTAVGINDLVAGHIDFMIDATNNTLPHVRAGSIKAYAVTAKSRLPSAPDIPTVDEAGLPGFHFSSWHALYAPKDTPAPVIAILQRAAAEALADPEVRRRLAELGQEVFPRDAQTPAVLAALQQADIAKWWPLIQESNIKIK